MTAVNVNLYPLFLSFHLRCGLSVVAFYSVQHCVSSSVLCFVFKFPLRCNPGSLVSKHPFTGVLRIALLPAADSPFDIFDDNCDVYPTGGHVDLSYEDDR